MNVGIDSSIAYGSSHYEIGNRPFLTQHELTEKELSGGLRVNLLQPPELSESTPQWNSRVLLPIPDMEIFLGAHLAKKANKPGCGDDVRGFHLPIPGEKGAHLGDLVGIMGVDGLTSDNMDRHRKDVRAAYDSLMGIDPTVDWNYPDLVIARHQSKLFTGDHFRGFASEAVRKIRLAHQKSMRGDLLDPSGGKNALLDTLGWDLFNARALHNLDLYHKIGNAYHRNPDSACDWNYRAPHGQVLYYFPNPKHTENWDYRGRPISHRLQSLADVFASPIQLSGFEATKDVTPSNVNILTDRLIDELLESRISGDEFSRALKEKLITQFDAFPVSFTDLRQARRAGRIVHYPDELTNKVRAGASVNTDGIMFDRYRKRTVGKKLWDLGNDVAMLINPINKVTALAQQLDAGGYTIDDRGIIALGVNKSSPYS